MLSVTNAQRDNFPRRVVDALGRRVSFHCSNPECWVQTIGAALNPLDILNIGVAAHITAAAVGGPRFDAKLTSAERSDYSNGIWLCQNCAKMVDNDPVTFSVYTLRKWKWAAEQRANREVGRPTSVIEAARVVTQRFKTAAELTATPEASAITHALFAPPNPYAQANLEIAARQISLLTEPVGLEFCRANFNAIVEELVADAAMYAEARDGVYRFITTNTTVEKVGQSIWFDSAGFRSLVNRTARILAGARASFELWRIFLLHNPPGVVESREVETFAQTLAENLSIGAHVAVASTAAFPLLPLDYSDFHCVPRRLAFVNVVPTYIAARFDVLNSDDRSVVECYSEIAEDFVDKAKTGSRDCFEWLGGSVDELQERLKKMSRRAA